MHNNYFLFKALVNELQPVLQGGVISACFSQRKEELVLQVETTGNPFFIRGLLLPVFSCISFPEEFHRARKNSIDLFEPLIGQRIAEVLAVENDRSFYLQLESGSQLVFKMHGNRSNIILTQPGKPNLLFKNQIISDSKLTVNALCKTVHYTREAFDENLHQPEKYFVTLGRPVWNYLSEKGYDQKDPEGKWKLFQEVLQQLNHPVYHIISDNHGLRLSLLDEPGVVQTFHYATTALTAFHSEWISRHQFLAEYRSIRKKLEQAAVQTELHIRKLNERLTELQQKDHFKEQADLLMANLHQVPSGAAEVVLPDFTTGNPVSIKLNPELSPQKNAEVYYRKSRNRNIELTRLSEQIAEASARLSVLDYNLQRLNDIHDLKQLRKITNDIAVREIKDHDTSRLPYREVIFNGFTIRIGRSAKDNDELTLKHSHKNDLWLHVRDVPGSHVIIRHQAGKPFPKEVIERAAQLAAWHSKRKNESLCPVMVTERKYVRKRKGDPPGQVVAERARTVLVVPKAD